ncbi:MAG: cation transporter [Oscillospiraceae bacterium]|nr:cation transporter [Oscillospiraceae bacterium]
MEPSVRAKKITQTSVVGIIANVFLAAFKAAVGLISGSIAIVLDAVNNLTDALSSVITIIGVKLARRRPDTKHPFGYGRIEYFSAIIISVIVLAAGVTSFIESVKKIFHPEMPDFSTVTIIIVALAVVVKFFLGRYVKAQGKRYNSDALVASGSDASFDAIISAATLVGALITLIFHITIDGYIGAVISVFIIKAGIEMLLESVSSVMGNRADSETTGAIKETVRSVDGVLGAYDLILHNYGPDFAIGSIHVEIPDDMSAEDIHKLTRRIQGAVLEKFKLFLTVGIYAVDSTRAEERAKINEIATQHDGVLGTHGVFFDEENRTVSFDATVDFTVRDKDALTAALSEEIGAVLPGWGISVNYDANYSD